MDMAGPAIRIGDQLILEEDYDETYIPSEQEIQEFAREIGIDPENEPELMWLAREGIVAPLPPEWKPCQDITGDIYYFNFSNGQSTWDHPCDEHYRELVIQEREKLSAHGSIKKKDKKKRKDKKEKKEKKEREPMKHAAEMQPEPGILPSTSFYRMSSPILSSECASPDLDQDSQMRNEGFLKKGKGKTSERPPETSDSNRQFAGPSPNKLQPLLTAKSCRTHQILADVEKILGRTPSFSRSDVDHQQAQDKSPKIGDKPCLDFSDSESEGLDVVRTKPISYVAKKSCSQDLENGRSVPDSREVLEDKVPLFVEEKLSDNRKKEEMTGESVCQSDEGLSVRERSTGPGGDKERGPGFSQADENEAFLTPRAPDHIFYSRKCEMILFDASPPEDLSLMEEGDVHCPQRELRAHSRAVESRRKRKLQDQALSQATKLCKSSEAVGKRERESSKQAEFVESEGAGLQAAPQKDRLDSHPAVPEMTADTLPYTRGVEVYAQAGADVSASEPVSLSAAQHRDKEKANGLGTEPYSSVASNSADHFASQILGEVDNFSWDLQSSRESDRPTDLLAAAAAKGPLPTHPFTGTLQTPPQSSANGKSQSDCNSEDEKFYQHVQENDQVTSQEHSCVSFNMKLNRSRDAPEKNNEGRQEETGEGEQKTEPVPRGLEAGVLTEGLQVSPGWLYQTAECQESSRLCRQVEGELTQSGKVTEDYSKLELCEGAGSNESPGSLLAPVQVPLGSLAPLRGVVDGPASALRGSLSTSVEISGVPSPLLREGTLPPQTLKSTGCTKSLLGSMHEEKASLNLLVLDEGENEEEESENQSPRGTARLLKNLHMDISALGGGFEYEESLKVSHAEESQTFPLDSDGVRPPAPDKLLDRDANSSLCGLNKEESSGKPMGTELLEKEDTDVEDAVSVAYEQSGTPGERTAEGTHVVSGQGHPIAASPDVRAAETDQLESVAVTIDTMSVSEKIVNGMREEAADLKTDSKLDAGKESEASEHVKELQVSDRSDHELLRLMDFGFQSRISEQVLDMGMLSAALDSPKVEAQRLGEEEKDQSKASLEEEQSKRPKVAESERDQRPFSACELAEEKCLSLENASQEETAALEQKEGSLDNPEEEEPAALHQEQLGEEMKQVVSLNWPSAESLKEIAREQKQELEQEKMRLLQAKEERVQRFQEELRQEEEEEAQVLHQQKEKSLRSLKEELAKASEEEELRMREEEVEKLSKLRAQISSETETEKEKIRAEQEAALQKLREEWESLRKVERESLEERKKRVLEMLKVEVEETQQREATEMEQEKERVLNELKERLERERKEAAEVLEKQFAAELQELKSTAEEKHQKVVSSFRKQIAEAQRSEEAQLHEELERAEQKVQQKMYRVAEFERELSELMKEKCQQVERDHDRKMERMKEEHKEVLARIQDQYEEEERKQRAKKLEELKGELERLRQLHDGELRALQKQLDEQLSDLRQSHKAKERKLQELEMELEIRATDARARCAQLNHQEEAMRKKRQQLLDEEKQTELQRNEAASAAQLRLEESRKEHADLVESIRQLRRTLEELQDQKAELESQVDLLQTRSQRLQRRISELEAAVQSKQETLKELVAEDSMASPRREAELHLEDLRETLQAHSSREPASLTSHSNEDSDLQLDNVRHFISAEGVSIKNAKEFLVRQTRSMRKRHTALKAAKQHWRHNMQQAQDAVQDPDSSQLLEDVRRNLEEESEQLDKMKSAMRKGQVLLKKKEEKLSQLESSLLEELSDEDTLKGAACKKVVTFDLSDSEDTHSLSSTDVPQHKFDLKPDVQFPQLDKIQHLTSTLQHITAELNGVLGTLGSLNHRQPLLFAPVQVPMPALPSDGVPLSTYTSLARAQAAGPIVPPAGIPLVNQWAWSTGLNSSLSSTAGQSVDNILAEKWRKYFPGGFPSLSGSPAPLDSNLGYLPAGEQIRLFQRSQLRGPETDSTSVQGMIDANKKWLENFKKDSKVPLFPSTQKPSASSPGLVQLGLDENNQIKVYHY
ncbi:centrosomal protein of 164 kDa isoform X2 [Mauremys mutica]|uniref:centrosomal protein of 164 kDa isoform X2 n=1 Tax=Mauremys mutica TaxID=74926 RepID=UPI001D15F377|nr:centrosomal protein of 164 kDa isoform X2 [Mauremys mutica]